MKNSIKFNDLQNQYKLIKSEIDTAIQSVLEDSVFIGGKYLKEFEFNFAKFLGANYCVGVANGTDALEIAIEALELPKKSEIIVPANSFISSAEAVTRNGHKVVFCDINPTDYNISIDDIEKRITDNTSAIVAVHLYGQPCEIEKLIKISKDKNLKIIEDCAQAHGATFKGKKVGSIGDIACFSFYPAKNLGAYGDGGAIVTNNENLAVKCRKIANHGRITKYNHEFQGRNSRLDSIQASILNVKLKYLEDWIKQRNVIANKYISELKNFNKIKLPEIGKSVTHTFHLFVIQHDERDRLREYLKSNGVETGIHYPIALPKLKAFNNSDKFDNYYACQIDSKLLSLPIGEHVTKNDVIKITNLIKNF